MTSRFDTYNCKGQIQEESESSSALLDERECVDETYAIPEDERSKKIRKKPVRPNLRSNPHNLAVVGFSQGD